jgi:ubiquinone biosynthesis protein
MNWELLLDETTLSWLLPDVYAHYRRPLRDALNLFLEGLSAKRLESIAGEQEMLPPTATVLDRLFLLARNCPVLQKLGQTLARDRNLPSELRGCLQRLESLSPSIPLEAVERALIQELGPMDRLGVKLLPPAVAEASVAVVVPFRLSAGKTPLDGVFKLLKPGIEQRLEEDLNQLEHVGSFLDKMCEDLQIPHLDYRDSFELVREKLQYEVRLDKEQRNLALAREFYRGDPRVQVPMLFDFCTPRVTAMERIIGQKVTECCLDRSEKLRMARLVIEALIARPIFSRDSQVLFHCDPHAGNLFAAQDRRLAILDWSLTGSLGERERISIMHIMLGAVSFSTENIVTVLCELSEGQPGDLPGLRAIVYKWIARIREGLLPGLTWLTGLLDEAVREAGLRFGADLMLFRKALLMVEGVVADIGGGTGLLDQVLMAEFAIRFSAELPWRFLALPNSHAFATRISNLDLAELMLSFPWRPIEFWLDRKDALPADSGLARKEFERY